MSRGKQDDSVSGSPSRRPGLAAQEDVWHEILSLAAAIESALTRAMQVLCEGRTDLVDTVEVQEAAIDRWEVRIEKECLRVLALYEPLASDLRRMVSALKLRAELERIGDLATKIARRSKRSARDSAAPPIPASLDTLARMTLSSFKRAVAALNGDDADAARILIAGDQEIDRQCRAVVMALKGSVRQQPGQVPTLLRMLNSTRNLERIGDHIVKIAEAILYIRGY
jgi:phosphate transport system protein